jgi:hypothetical protein
VAHDAAVDAGLVVVHVDAGEGRLCRRFLGDHVLERTEARSKRLLVDGCHKGIVVIGAERAREWVLGTT